jgi:hypothetical protein
MKTYMLPIETIYCHKDRNKVVVSCYTLYSQRAFSALQDNLGLVVACLVIRAENRDDAWLQAKAIL